jgi:hypothetical protein
MLQLRSSSIFSNSSIIIISSSSNSSHFLISLQHTLRPAGIREQLEALTGARALRHTTTQCHRTKPSLSMRSSMRYPSGSSRRS